MGRASNAQHSLNSGELSPLILGRQDLDKYASGLFVCLNAIPLVQGGWTRRPGMAYLHQTKFNTKRSRVIPFQYSTVQTYILEFGAGYIRFFTQHGILTQTAQSITSVTNANPGVVTKTAHGYSNGARLHLSSVLGMTQIGNREVVVTNATANAFELWDTDGFKIDTTGYDAFVSGNMAQIFEMATAFTEADLPLIRVTQSADTLYIFHPNYPQQTLVRVSALSWTLSNIVFTDGPYGTVNLTTTTMTPAATSGSTTLTASSIVGINLGVGFLASDVGRLVRIQHSSTWGYALITAYTSTTQVSITVLSNFGAITGSVNWRLGVWSATTGYPACGTFYEDRLVQAGAALTPQRLDFSMTSNYSSYSPSATDGTVAANNAISYVLNSDDVNAIKWMSPNEKGLLAGTGRSEWLVRADSLGSSISPTAITAKSSTSYGSDGPAAVNAGRTVLYVQRAGRKLRELSYTWMIDGFTAPDMTILSEHITTGKMLELAYQEQPQAIVWSTRGDGVMLGFTYERDQNVTAWHRHELGGQSDAAGLLVPVVESVAVVPAPDGSRDELYTIVNRWIGGRTRRYIEYMSKIWESTDTQENAFHLDAGWTQIDAPATTVITGLNHLEGETVSVYADGSQRPDAVVTNGKITLTLAAVIKTVGYAYNSDGQTMPLEGGTQDGSAQGKIKRIAKLGFWLLDTLGLKFGIDVNSLTEILVRTWGVPMGTETPLFTGVTRERFEGDYDKLGQVYWRCDGPFPATVLAIMPQFEVSDDS